MFPVLRLPFTLASLLCPVAAGAVTVQVTHGDDAGAGSLRAAIELVNASPGDDHQIVFTTAFPQDGLIDLFSSLPAINRPNVEILGFGRPQLYPFDVSNSFTYFIAGPNLQRLRLQGMRINFGRASVAGTDGGGCVLRGNLGGSATLELDDMQFQGCAAPIPGFARGGAVHWQGGTVTVRRSQFFENIAISTSGSDAGGGAIYASSVVIEDSVFVDNRVTGRSAGGGAIRTIGDTTVTASQFTYNDAQPDATPNAFAQGGAVSIDCYSPCNVSLQRAYFGFNGSAGVDYGGALFVRGNGSTVPLQLENVSFDGNQAEAAGALWTTATTLDARHLTFSDNLGTPAHLGMAFNGDVALRNSVLTTAATPGCDLHSAGTGEGSVAGDATCAAALSGATSVADLQPLETVLTLPMSYVRFAADSAVIDRVAIVDCADEDALGQARPADGNDDGLARCDAGAYEHPGAAIFADGFE